MPYRYGVMERGDIPRGGFLGSIVKVVGGAVGGLLTGGPIGGIKGAVKGTINAVKSDVHPFTTIGVSGATQPIASIAPPVMTLNTTSPEELVRQHQVNVHKAQAKTVASGNQTHAVIQKQLGAGGGNGGRRRRMQVTNTRALRRAIRRAQGFAKIAMKTIKIVHPQKKGKFGGFKRRAKR